MVRLFNISMKAVKARREAAMFSTWKNRNSKNWDGKCEHSWKQDFSYEQPNMQAMFSTWMDENSQNWGKKFEHSGKWDSPEQSGMQTINLKVLSFVIGIPA